MTIMVSYSPAAERIYVYFKTEAGIQIIRLTPTEAQELRELLNEAGTTAMKEDLPNA